MYMEEMVKIRWIFIQTQRVAADRTEHKYQAVINMDCSSKHAAMVKVGESNGSTKNETTRGLWINVAEWAPTHSLHVCIREFNETEKTNKAFPDVIEF